MNLVGLLILAVWAVSAGDAYTTWLMLREPVPGWEVWEANPVSRFLFDTFGLAAGLVIDSLATFVAGLWVYTTNSFPDEFKIVGCLVVCLITGYAIHNNVQVLYTTGVW